MASITVGKKSTPEMKCFPSIAPAFTTPGQRTNHGVRVLAR